MSDCYQVNAPTVVSEIVDGEAIIMRLDTGNYYSLAGAGAYAWRLIGLSVPVDGVVESVAGAFAGDRISISETIHGLVERLVEEGLIVPGEKTGAPPAPPPESQPSSPLPPFEPPELREYTDMQDLLLVDPIHEVEESGWPKAVPESAD